MYIGQISNKLFENNFLNLKNIFNLDFTFSVNGFTNKFFTNSFSLDFSHGDKFVFTKKPLNNFQIDLETVFAKDIFLFSFLSTSVF